MPMSIFHLFFQLTEVWVVMGIVFRKGEALVMVSIEVKVFVASCYWTVHETELFLIFVVIRVYTIDFLIGIEDMTGA